jgi:hypothetical protein
MLHNRRYGRAVVVPAWAQFASALADRDQLKRELAETRADRDELRARLIELCAAIRARQDAEDECRRLYRERNLSRARAAERDPAQALN